MAVLDATGAEKIDLIGHSAGGGLATTYLQTNNFSEKVNKYIHVGSFPIEEVPSIPVLNLYSEGDYIADGREIEDLENHCLIDEDHYQVVTSEESFEIMYSFLYEEPPSTTAIPNQDGELTLYGKATYFGDNTPMTGSEIEIFQVDDNGRPKTENAYARTVVGEHGVWGPLHLNANERAEIRVIQPSGMIIRHFYPAFQHSNRLIRLRGLPTEGFAANLLSQIPFEDESTVSLVTFSKSQSMVYGRDSLRIEGEEMVTSERAAAEDTIIAMFHFDNGVDQQQNEDPDIFGLFPYMAATDLFIPADESQTISVNFNGEALVVPRYGKGVILTLQ